MDTNKTNKLFDEFPPVSTAAWEEKISEDLKGADYEKKLIWQTMEGFKIKPYYRSEHLPPFDYTQSLPGTFPYVRGFQSTSNVWRIREEIIVEDITLANQQALATIARGVTAISFIINNLSYQEELDQLLQGIDLETIGIHFFSSFSYPILANLLIDFIQRSSFNPNKIKGSLNFDSIAYYLKHGEYYNSKEDNFNEAASLFQVLLNKLPSIKYLNVNGYMFNHAGGTAVQELAYVISMANEYLAALTDRGISIDEVCEHMQLTFAVGSNYFMEIAKFRAARLLWSRLIEQYKPTTETSYTIALHAISSRFNKSLYDPYVNLLRLTTECMSAAIGGAGAITLLPFSNTYKNADDFSLRLSRNIQIILKEESHLDKVIDPAAGSYYLEALTDELAQYAWEYFKRIEDAGGFLSYMEQGRVKEEIEKVAAQRKIDIANRKTPILGTNIFPNIDEQMLSEITLLKKKKTEGYLQFFRGAEIFEEIRIATEKWVQQGKSRPKVLPITYGNLSMRKARATFSSNFFGCAGYEISAEYFSKDIVETCIELKKQNANIAVICSSDDEYGDYAASLTRQIKSTLPDTIIVIAGYPKEHIAVLTQSGVDEFIHVKVNAAETLHTFHKKLGVI